MSRELVEEKLLDGCGGQRERLVCGAVLHWAGLFGLGFLGWGPGNYGGRDWQPRVFFLYLERPSRSAEFGLTRGDGL